MLFGVISTTGTGLAWLPESQIRSALTYYQFYPEEIDARLRREEAMTPATGWQE